MVSTSGMSKVQILPSNSEGATYLSTQNLISVQMITSAPYELHHEHSRLWDESLRINVSSDLEGSSKGVFEVKHSISPDLT